MDTIDISPELCTCKRPAIRTSRNYGLAGGMVTYCARCHSFANRPAAGFVQRLSEWLNEDVISQMLRDVTR